MLKEKQTKKLNEKFNALSVAEKRIQIAKDVLLQIKGKKIFPRAGSYISLANKNQFNESVSVQKVIGEFECSCCALGACLLSTTKYLNKITWGGITSNLDSSSKNWNILKGIFTPKQLLMIEVAFECRDSWESQRVGMDTFGALPLTDMESIKCYTFSQIYIGDPKNRLIAIMKNIIKNKGIFKP